MIYSLSLTLLSFLLVGGLHTLLKKQLTWRLNNGQFLLCLSPIPFGLLVFTLGYNAVSAPFSTGLNLIILMPLSLGLLLYALNYRIYWALVFLPLTLSALALIVGMVLYLVHVRHAISPDPFMLPEPFHTGLNILASLNIWLLLSAPITTLFAVIYHRFFKKRPLRIDKDTLCIGILLGSVLFLNGLSMLILIGIVGSID